MESTKKTAELKPKQEKLSYEQLEAYAQQVLAKAQQVYQENRALKQALEEARVVNTFKEIDCAFKCLDHAEMFSPTFIEQVVAKLEELLTPRKEEAETPENTKEGEE